MSMNVMILATREVQVLNTNQVETQEINFQVIDTPTKVTWAIMDLDTIEDQLKTYTDYILSISNTHVENIYADDDVWCEREPIGTREYNWGLEHVEELNDWCKEAIDGGYAIKFEVC